MLPNYTFFYQKSDSSAFSALKIIRTLQSMSNKKLRKVLVIRYSSIGDIVLCSPVFRTLKKQLGTEIHWLTKSGFAFINEYNPYIDKTFKYDHNLKEIIPALIDEDYDLVIDLHKNIRSWRMKRSLGKPVLTFDKINFEKWILTNFRRDIIKEPRHLVDRYFAALEKIGIRNDEEGLDYFYDPEVTNPVPVFPYIAYGIGGTYHTKKMPAKHIIRHFSNLPHPLVLLGGKSEIEAAEEIEKSLGDRCINLVNRCNLHTTGKILEEAEWVISHDTATMHMAAAFRKKILSIWGATAPALGMTPYLPGSLNHQSVILEKENLSCHPCSKLGNQKCPRGHFKCMTTLDQEIVDQKIRQINNLKDPDFS